VPEPVSELIGRDHALAEVVNLIGAHRLVTLIRVLRQIARESITRR
jgi:hypothetical protein